MAEHKRKAITRPTVRDDIDCVLQMARDQLEHMKRDAEHDEDCAADYRDSKAALERVSRDFRTAHIVIARRSV